MIADIGRPLRFAVMLLALTSVSFSPLLAVAQPRSGIDPCARALAELDTPAPEQTPSPAGNRLAVSQTVMHFASCFNGRWFDGILAFTDDAFRLSMFGESDPQRLTDKLTALDERGLMPGIRIQSIEENGTTGTTLATLVVTWRGWNDLHRELWRLQRDDSHWRLTGRSVQTPSVFGTAVGITFALGPEGLVSPRTALVSHGLIMLSFINEIDQDVSAYVLKAEPTDSVSDVVRECSTASGHRMRPVGSITIPVGHEMVLPLDDLAPGPYVVVVGPNPCLVGEYERDVWAQPLEILAPSA